MVVTYLKDKDRYVDSSGRTVTAADYGKNFYACDHDFRDTNRRGSTRGPNGKLVDAIALQCTGCGVFTVLEVSKKKNGSAL